MKSNLSTIGLFLLAVLIVWGVSVWTLNLNKNSVLVENVSTRTPTFTKTFNATIQPTATATETPIPPTNTPTPTMTPTSNVILPNQLNYGFIDPKITFYETFTQLDELLWGGINNVSVSNGTLKYITIPDGGSIYRRSTFKGGQGVLLDFRYSNEIAYFTIAFQTGTGGTADYKKFGFGRESDTGFQANVVENNGSWYGSVPQWTRPNVWYRLAMGIGQNGKMVMLIWQREKPDTLPWVLSTQKLNKDPSNMSWSFRIGGEAIKERVTINVENYYEIGFSDIK